MDLTASSTAVITVHMQHDIVAAQGAFGGFFAAQATERGVVGIVGKLLDGARAAGATVVYTRVAFRPDFADLVPNSPLLGMVGQQRCLVDGTEQAEILPELTPHEGDMVITHQRVGGFTASQLDLRLRSAGIDTVLFTGVATNASVEGTARQASDLGYRTIVVADGCSAADAASHDAAVGSLGLLAEIATSTDVLEALGRGSAR